jgi:arginase
MQTNSLFYLLGYASGIGGPHSGSTDAPAVMQHSPYLAELSQDGVDFKWSTIVKTPNERDASKLSLIQQQCALLAASVTPLVEQKHPFAVIGGDHTAAIGTWSGVSAATHKKGPIGLIWIDAHMDSHTPDTSETGNIHGMPLATLLGHGSDSLVNLATGEAPKLQAENICLIGSRSFEPDEEKLLKKLNVKVFYMNEVKERGFEAVLNDALALVNKNTIGYGLSIDMDGMDPADAPGTGVAEPDGLSADEVCQALACVHSDSRLIGVELVEFDPSRDKNHITEKLMVRLLSSIILGRDKVFKA